MKFLLVEDIANGEQITIEAKNEMEAVKTAFKETGWSLLKLGDDGYPEGDEEKGIEERAKELKERREVALNRLNETDLEIMDFEEKHGVW